MKTKMKTRMTLAIGIVLSVASCGSPETIYDLDQAGEIEEIKKELIAAAGDIMAYEITLSSSEELTTSLGNVEVVTNEAAAEGTLNRNSYQLIDPVGSSVELIDREFSVRVYKKNDPKKLSEIDFSLVEKNIATAKAQIPPEYVDHSIYSYRIEFDDNKRADTFTINCVKEGESDYMEGREMITNYYEFPFEMDENGEVIMLIE